MLLLLWIAQRAHHAPAFQMVACDSNSCGSESLGVCTHVSIMLTLWKNGFLITYVVMIVI
jgi:hypothetical protein